MREVFDSDDDEPTDKAQKSANKQAFLAKHGGGA
jgi:hypothetical protein